MTERATLEDFGSIAAGETPTHSWRRVDLPALDLEPPTQPNIAGLGYPGSRHHLSGEPESLKTWLVLALCDTEIRVGNVVVYLDFENGARAMLGRLRDLNLDDDQIRSQFVYIAPDEPIATAGIRDDVDRMLVGLAPTLCVIDSMAGALALHDLDPNSAKDVEKFSQAVIDPLRAQGAATFTLDHVTKNRDTRGRYATGSERKVGATDVHLGIEAVQTFGRGKTGKAKIVVHKDRHGWLPRPKCAELELSSDPATHRVSYRLALAQDNDDSGRFRPTKLMERVSIYLEQAAEPRSRNQVEEAVKGRREYVRLALDVLRAEGFIAEEDGPKGARLVRPIGVFRETSDNLAPTSPQPRPGDLAQPRPTSPPSTEGAGEDEDRRTT